MARTGLSKSQVQNARQALIADGRYPSADAVRMELGNTGSKTTIHRYLKELESEAGAAAERRVDTSLMLQTMVQQLADKLHEDAERRVRAARAEHEAILHSKELELAELREQLASLSAQVKRMQERRSAPPQAGAADSASGVRKGIRDIGFGIFGNLLSATRGGIGDASIFSNLINGGRTEILDQDSLNESSFLKFR